MSKQALWPASGLIFLGMPQDFGTLDPPQLQLLVGLHLRPRYLKSAYARQMADDLTTLTPRTCDGAPGSFIFPLLYVFCFFSLPVCKCGNLPYIDVWGIYPGPDVVEEKGSIA